MTMIGIDGLGFRKLVRGETLEIDGTKIILADIGFSIMRNCIDEAEREQSETHPSGHTPIPD